MSDEPRFYKESPCAHGCGRTSIVQHADGRVLCRVCYQAEVGMDGPVPGCPTCEDLPAYEHRLDNAQARVADAASLWCWHATPENEGILRDAVAEYRTALGLWKLARREARDGGDA